MIKEFLVINNEGCSYPTAGRSYASSPQINMIIPVETMDANLGDYGG